MLHLYSMHALGLTDTLKTLENLGLEVTDEMRIPLQLPEDRQCYLYRYEVRASGERIACSAAGEERFVEALRRLDEERATDDALNGLDPVGRADLARSRSPAHRAQPSSANPHPLQRRNREPGASEQQLRSQRAVPLLRRAL